METEKPEFEELTPCERVFLLEAIGIDKDNLVCAKCGKKADYKTCCIISPKVAGTKKTVILCDSTLCMSEFVGDIERSEDAQKKP